MLKSAVHSDFDLLYSLLENSFPADEYRPYADQLALLADPRYQLLTNDDRTLLISLWEFPEFTFIEHFAVSAALRGQGIGTEVLRRILSDRRHPIILEAELPDTLPARRRLGFYQRNHFTVNPYPYLQPAYAPDRNPVKMCLLSTEALSQAQFDIVKKTLYNEVYKMKGRS